MANRDVTYREAADLLSAYGDRRIRPLVRVGAGPIDMTLEDACDGLCIWLADDPERDLTDVPEQLLRLLWARMLFAVGACETRPDDVIGRVPRSASDDELLAGLLGEQLAGTKLPPSWRDGPPGGWRH